MVFSATFGFIFRTLRCNVLGENHSYFADEGSIKLVVSTSSWQFSEVHRSNAKRSTYGPSEDRQLEGSGVEEVASVVSLVS